jgi:hypothetical protein
MQYRSLVMRASLPIQGLILLDTLPCLERIHSAIPLEELSEVLIGRGARQVANKKVHAKVLLELGLSQSPE